MNKLNKNLIKKFTIQMSQTFSESLTKLYFKRETGKWIKMIQTSSHI